MELPPKARIKLTLLADAQQAAQDHAQSIMRRISAAEKSLATMPGSEHGVIQEEIARLRGKFEDGRQRARAAADLNARLSHFLDTIGDADIADAKPRSAKVERGESLTLVAARIRTRIVALSAERRKVERCGLPIAEAKKQAEAYVNELARRGRPTISFGHDRPCSVGFNATVEGAYTAKLDIAAALAWLDAPAFLKRLMTEIEAQPEQSLAMTAKARAEKLAALDAELLILEREDEACVEISEVEGPFILRRPDADPRAVLGITLAPKKSEVKAARVRAETS